MAVLAYKFHEKVAIFLPVLSGIFLFIGYVVPSFSWFIFVGAIPVCIFFDTSSKKMSFWGSLLFALIFFGLVTSWIFSAVSSLTLLGISNSISAHGIIAAFWLVGIIPVSVLFGLFGIGWKLSPISLRIILIPSLWIALEYARAWLITILFAGSETLFGPYWTFGALGYSLSNFSFLLQSAKIWGLYGASFFVIGTNIVLYEVLRRRSKVSFVYGGVWTLALFLVVLYGWSNFEDQEQAGIKKDFVVVQTAVSPVIVSKPEEFRELVLKSGGLLQYVASYDGEVVVFPEGSNFSALSGERTAENFVATFNGSRTVKIIDSAQVDTSGNPAPFRVFVYDTEKGLVMITDKTLLVPAGEYIPYVVMAPAKLLGRGEWVERMKSLQVYKRGLFAPDASLNPSGQPEGVLLSSAIFAPSLWRALTRDFAQVLVNPTSHVHFKDSRNFHRQGEMAIRFFAAANDRWFIQAANSGFSYIIDNHGVIQKRSLDLNPIVVTGKVQYRTSIPFWVRVGDWPILTSCLALLIKFAPSFFAQLVNVYKRYVKSRKSVKQSMRLIPEDFSHGEKRAQG